MTAPREGGARRRRIARLERLAGALQVSALLHQREAEEAGDGQDAKAWWRVSRAAAEADQALKEMRGAPGLGELKPAVDRPKRESIGDSEIDHLGVPVKKKRDTDPAPAV